MHIIAHYIVMLLPSFSLKRIIVSALRVPRIQKRFFFPSQFSYQLSITISIMQSILVRVKNCGNMFRQKILIIFALTVVNSC